MRALSYGVGFVLVAWTLLLAVPIVQGFTTNCAHAASEISDPCALGLATWTLGTLGLWAIVAGPLAAALLAIRRRARGDRA